MYLLTFVTLIIGIIAIYAQVLAVQTARIAATQTGIGGYMMSWQAAAVTMGANILDTNAAGYAPIKALGTGRRRRLQPDLQ